MKTIEIRQKLHHYIDTAEEKKIKAIFMMVEDEIEETFEHWQEEDFLNELKEREANYLKGTKTYSIEQAASRAKQAIKKAKRKQ